MSWDIKYLPEADKDLDSLSRQQQVLVKKAIKKVQGNPLPQSEGGYGKPLGHKHGLNLTNLLKIKLRGEGIRVVYKLVKTESQMLIIVIGVREDDVVYEIAHTRRTKHDI
ncbi:MAG: type II toxin-antitoxin system RelE/ParE family toxin [Clostridia bacterium]|nr:type II toxin-antitoxin system RelE/ParE family toxin [Clostridia bacterium]MBQ6120886.1 type II toxin-antitoxin system RelE/ParE family toxin [Clostridia bacterium]